MSNQVSLGNGTIVEVAPLPTGQLSAPAERTFTVAGGGASAAATSIVISNATTIDLGGTSSKPAYLGFTNPDGTEVLAAVTAPIAGTTITVQPLVDDVAASATAPVYSVLAARQSADLALSPGTEEINTLDNDGWVYSIPTTKSASISAPGYLVETNPAYKNCEAAFLREARTPPVYVRLITPPPTAQYDTGTIVEGAAYPSIDQITNPAGATRQAAITFNFVGAPTITDPAA